MINYVEDLKANDSFVLVVDGLWHIFREYESKLSEQDAAYDLVFRTVIPSGRFDLVDVGFLDGIAILPPCLDDIVTDDDDKKFVAVADKHHSNPPIVNATDDDWLCWEDGLREHGIEVIQLCPSELEKREVGD